MIELIRRLLGGTPKDRDAEVWYDADDRLLREGMKRQIDVYEARLAKLQAEVDLREARRRRR